MSVRSPLCSRTSGSSRSTRSRLGLFCPRITPCTSYPLASSSSARYRPSWPVMPVISAVGMLGLCRTVWAAPSLAASEAAAAHPARDVGVPDARGVRPDLLLLAPQLERRRDLGPRLRHAGRARGAGGYRCCAHGFLLPEPAPGWRVSLVRTPSQADPGKNLERVLAGDAERAGHRGDRPAPWCCEVLAAAVSGRSGGS